MEKKKKEKKLSNLIQPAQGLFPKGNQAGNIPSLCT